MRFGFNDLGGDLTWLLHSYPPAAFVTFDAGRARWLKDAFPEAVVIYRHMAGGGDGGNYHVAGRTVAQHFAAAFDACGGDLRIVYQLCNEPDQDLPLLAAQTCAAMDAADARGATVAVLGFSVCHPDAGDWAGPLLPVLRKLAGSRHYLLMHEYFLQGGGEWCIGQFRNAYAACGAAGIAHPQVILGEFGFDLPGWKQLQPGGLTDEVYAAALVKAWNEVYAPAGVKAACIYAWGAGDVWADYRVDDAGAFLTALKASTLAEPAPILPAEPTEPEEPDMPDITELWEYVAGVDARLAVAEGRLAAHLTGHAPEEPPPDEPGDCEIAWWCAGHAVPVCPAAPAIESMIAFLWMDTGMMIWLAEAPGTIYVVYWDSPEPRWEAFPDVWTDAEPERVDLPEFTGPRGLWQQPSRGFGRVWREIPSVRLRLGWAQREWGDWYVGRFQFGTDGTLVLTGPEGRGFELYGDQAGWEVFAVE